MHAELPELAACMPQEPCVSRRHRCSRCHHLGEGSVEFLDDLGIRLELIAIGTLAVVLLFDVEAGGSPEG